MKLWERIKWIAALAGISWPFAAPFIILVLINLVYFSAGLLLAALAQFIFGSRALEVFEGVGMVIALVDGFGFWFLILWTVGYAVLQLLGYFTHKDKG